MPQTQSKTDPLILAFDTAGPHCAAAVVQGSRVLAARSEPMERGQAERLVDLLAEVLRNAGRTWPDLTAVACGTGPGNFTGVRISVAAARGLALALRIPAIGVTSFDALALDAALPCLVALDARRGECYAQRFGAPGEDGWGPTLVATDESLPLDGAATLIGEVPALQGRGAPLPDPADLATRIARAAADRLGSPQPRPAPLYLRAADAAPPREAPPPILP